MRALISNRREVEGRDPQKAEALWSGLLAGSWSLVTTAEGQGTRFLIARRTPASAGSVALTAPERQLAARLARGQALKVIAYELGVSAPTISTRVQKVLAKLGLRSRAELVRVFSR